MLCSCRKINNLETVTITQLYHSSTALIILPFLAWHAFIWVLGYLKAYTFAENCLRLEWYIMSRSFRLYNHSDNWSFISVCKLYDGVNRDSEFHIKQLEWQQIGIVGVCILMTVVPRRRRFIPGASLEHFGWLLSIPSCQFIHPHAPCEAHYYREKPGESAAGRDFSSNLL